MAIEKRELYEEKAKAYPAIDRAAGLRFKRAISCAAPRPSDKVLDIGCKFGILNDLLREKQPDIDYHGVDISMDILRRNADEENCRFYNADVMDGLPFPDGKFDWVFILELLEHVDNPTLCLREIRRVLKSDGRLILSVPNPYCWSEIVSNLRGIDEDEGHISAWTPQLMGTLARMNDFKIERRIGTSTRVPFSRRIFGDRSWIIPTNRLFLSRSFIYVMSPLD